MYPEYFYWHYIAAPRWLMTLAWNLQRALLQFFSVPLILRTLFAHWHRDAIPYRGGSLTFYLNTFLLNTISRMMGFIVRLFLLSVWLLAEASWLAASLIAIVVFLLAPLMIIVTAAWGIVLLWQ